MLMKMFGEGGGGEWQDCSPWQVVRCTCMHACMMFHVKRRNLKIHHDDHPFIDPLLFYLSRETREGLIWSLDIFWCSFSGFATKICHSCWVFDLSFKLTGQINLNKWNKFEEKLSSPRLLISCCCCCYWSVSQNPTVGGQTTDRPIDIFYFGGGVFGYQHGSPGLSAPKWGVKDKVKRPKGPQAQSRSPESS